MTFTRLTLFTKACLISSLALSHPFALAATERSIPELVDAVNGTPDEASRNAGKEVKLRNHAKGFCTSGRFTPNLALQDTLNIPFFKQEAFKVTARFSLGGTNPKLSDKTPGRFLSLKIDGDKENLNLVTTNSPIFFASNLEEFFTFQTKVKQGPEGKQWLIDNQAHAKAFFDYIKQLPPSPSFAQSRYHGVNSFLFSPRDNDTHKGTTVAGKWIIEPQAGTAAYPPMN